MAETYDLIVLGSGPGGYVAAIRAASSGSRPRSSSARMLGGICLNWGCIPTKALLRSAEIFHYMQHADAYGLEREKAGFDLAKIVERSRGVAKQLNQGVTRPDEEEQDRRAHGRGQAHRQGQADRHRRTARRPSLPPSTSSSPPAPGRATCRSPRPTASASGPIATRWRRRRCRPSCWSSARARSGSSSPASIPTWAPR